MTPQYFSPEVVFFIQNELLRTSTDQQHDRVCEVDLVVVDDREGLSCSDSAVLHTNTIESLLYLISQQCHLQPV